MAIIFSVPRRFEAAYQRAVAKLIIREVPSLPSNELEIGDWLDNLAKVSESDSFLRDANRVANAMVRDINIHNAWKWKEAARETTSGARVSRYIYETRAGTVGDALEDQVDLSTEFITDLPLKVAQTLRKQIEYVRAQGVTEKGVLNILRRRYSSLLSQRVNILGRTDPHRTNSALTEARSSDLNIHCFKWQTVGDQVVRRSHRIMEGVIVFWSDLPSPELLAGMIPNLGRYAPGNCPNCRCSALPCFNIDTIFDGVTRAKVFFNDRIHLLTRVQFMRIIS